MSKEINWYKNPTKKTLIIFGLLWLVSNMLLVLALTDLFTESILKTNNILITPYIIGSTSAVLGLYLRYYKKNNIKLNFKTAD